tara:strand:- start:4244 stop:4915 length:672 start_codon:yes stop_codon:yes gene_type:complete
MLERILDILFSLISILFFLPIFAIIITILKFSGEGEIFFLQDRIGKDGKSFKMIKFATMLKNSPNVGSRTVTLNNDPRILPFGYFLRKSKINELPQLLNIIFGQMSFIGPRPLTKETFNLYPNHIKKEILKIKPGLSGIGSIIFRQEENLLDETNLNSNFYKLLVNYKGEVEMWFVNNKNIFNYFRLICLTIFIIIFPNSNLLWKSIKNLPIPPDELKKYLNF